MPARTLDASQWLRAARRARRLSQRELAAQSGVPLSTIAAIESGRRSPTMAVVQQLLSATGHRLVVVDETGLALPGGDVHDGLRDRGGRQLPAHLKRDSPAIPERVVAHRPREARGPLREHPWFGQFRGRNACFGPASEPCANCVGDCRFGPGLPQSRPSDGPPEVPPA